MSKESLKLEATAVLIGPKFESCGKTMPRTSDIAMVKESIVVSTGNFKI